MTAHTSPPLLRLTGLAGILGAVLWTLGDILLIGANAPATDYPLILETYAGEQPGHGGGGPLSSRPRN